jgi:predicted GIY-YIG superfamily endonuclease
MERRESIIYLLRLVKGKYYVGKTNDMERRYTEHIDGTGSEWTKLYPPIGFKILKKNPDRHDENRFVKEVMTKKGIDNVRGGSYSSPNLSSSIKAYIYNEIKGDVDRCFNCGGTGHFSVDCKNATVTVYNQPDILSKPLTAYKCGLCGKTGHNKRTCSKKK